MRNMLLVIRHEILATFAKRSFWVMTFLLPLIIVVFNFGYYLLADRMEQETDKHLVTNPQQAETQTIGYVDQAGLIVRLPESVSATLLRSYADEDYAHQALKSRQITAYVVITENYVATGKITVVLDDFGFGKENGPRELIEYVINANLLGDESVALALNDPSPFGGDAEHMHRLVSEPTKEEEETGPLASSAPYAIMFLFYMILITSGSLVLRSVAEEKENRVVEILLLSLRPRDLVVGKVLGLGLVALMQLAMWLGVGVLVLSRGQGLLAVVRSLHFPPGFALYALLYVILGHLVYASAYGVLGTLASNVREGNQFQIVILLPLIIPLTFNFVFLEEPNGAFATFVSLFPLTSPTCMMARMAMVEVPAWQAFVGLGGLAVTAYLFVLLSARFYRADTLLSGGGLSLARIAKEFRG